MATKSKAKKPTKAKSKNDAPREDYHVRVANDLIKRMEEGTAPWQKPWRPGEAQSSLPMNPTTGKPYRGINAIVLMSAQGDDPRWMTYKQATDAGAQVRKGERGTTIQYWQFREERNRKDEQGAPVKTKDGKAVKDVVVLKRPKVFFATVFNASQIDGLEPLPVKEPMELGWNVDERAENILKASGAVIQHKEGDRASYNPVLDRIHLPLKEQFADSTGYYATALHELGHWTGHSSRLDRDLTGRFGSESYAKEELRAEISSMMLAAEIGVSHDPGQHASYVQSWIKALKEDPKEIFRAAADADKIVRHVMTYDQEHQQEQQSTREESAYKTPATVAVPVVVAAAPTKVTTPVVTGRASQVAAPAQTVVKLKEPERASHDR